MLRVAMILFALIAPIGAVNFPVAPLGMCYDGIEHLVEIGAYPGSEIAYNSQMDNGQGHVWLRRGDKIIDSYWGEKDNSSLQWVPEETFQTFDEFERSLRISYP